MNEGKITFSQSENSTNTTPHTMAATMQAPMYPPKPACGAISRAGAMNTKLPTCTMGIFAPRGPTPKLCTNVHMPLTNSADAIRMDVSSGPKPRPPAMSSGAGRVWNRMSSACCRPKAPSSAGRGHSFMP